VNTSMKAPIPVTVLGATGAVGQRFVSLLADHPWFVIAGLAASERSAGQRYAAACRWVLDTEMPACVRDMPVLPLGKDVPGRLVFSALPGDLAGPFEEELADEGYAVCSNASAHRMDADVPLLIPEVNPDHIGLIEAQRRRRGGSGFIATNPNCTTTVMVMALAPLARAFGIRRLHAVSLQALSGAGYPGVPSLDVVDNTMPYIGGEEEKVQSEPQKLLGTLAGDRVVPAPFVVSAQCNRVPVLEGHSVCVSVELEQKATPEQAAAVLAGYRALPQELGLPSAPAAPIVVRSEPDRPQPRRDRDAGRGMAVTVGRIKEDPVLGLRFVVLGHNTVRGAAGGSLVVAELLSAQGYLSEI
jgi:aspartate-semialdehyde dehydrogenase